MLLYEVVDLGSRYDMNENLFPAVIREKIRNGELVFPPETEENYEAFEAYRCCFRKTGEDKPICREDFRSYFEEKKKLRGNYLKNPLYYGVSLFCDDKELENVNNMNKPVKKIAKGYVIQEGGPCYKKRTNSHVTWWLFEKVDLSSFKEIG